MFFSLHPNSEIFDLTSTLVEKFDISTNRVIGICGSNSTLSDESSTWDSFAFKFDDPDSSALWNSFYFYVIILDQVWAFIFGGIVVRMVRLEIWEILGLINLGTIFSKVFLQVNPVYLHMDIINIFDTDF